MLSSRFTQLVLIVVSSLLVASTLAQDAVPAKKPVPDAAAQAQALKLVKEVYGDEYAKAKTADQKVALAKKLLQKADETRNDPNALYALLNVANDMAVLAANADTAFAAIDALAQTFEVNPLELKTEALIAASKKARLPAEHGAIAKQALAVMDGAIAADGCELATKVGELGLAEARLAPQSKMTRPILARLKEARDLATAYESMRKADAILETTPTDPDANLTVGKYLCLVKGDWDRGISYLALGNDEPLKALAIKELKGVPDAEGQVALGDGWRDLATASEGVAQKQLQGRTAYWYRKALPRLTGLMKEKVEKRLRTSSGEDNWIDLLKSVDPRHAGVTGTWNLLNEELVGYHPAEMDESARIVLSCRPGLDYRVRLQFTRTEGSTRLAVILPVGSTECLFSMSAVSNEYSGIEMVRGKYLNDEGGSGAQRRLMNDKPHQLDISVRVVKPNVQIVALLDEKPHFAWQGPYDSLSPRKNYESPVRGMLGLALGSPGSSRVIFHQIKYCEGADGDRKR